jgi:arylsulfatase A-like enzyme
MADIITIEKTALTCSFWSMSQNSRPNILWITTDSQRWDTVAALGHPAIRTPNLDRLCRRGVACARAYSQSPVCTPSRASFLTGRYPSAIGVPRNGNARYPGAAPLATRLLADAGYDCAMIGKLHIASVWTGTEARTDDGYTYWRYSHAASQGIGGGNQYADWLLARGVDLERVFQRRAGGDLGAYQPDVPSELTHAAWVGDRAVEFVRTRCRRPWLASVNFFDPHPPFTPAARLRARYRPDDLPRPRFGPETLALQERLKAYPVFSATPKAPGPAEQEYIADYYATIELIDEQVGRVLAALEEIGQLEETLIVFHSDHGESLGDHGWKHKGCRFYEGSVRIPLIWSWPRAIDQGRVLEQEVGLVDVAPTLLELLGLPAPAVHGESLAGALRGGEFGPRRRPVRCEYHDAVDFEAPHPRTTAPASATMVVEDRRKLVVYHGCDIGELYLLDEDPDELRNRWEDPACAALRERLMKRCFDATVMGLHPGEPLIGRY